MAKSATRPEAEETVAEGAEAFYRDALRVLIDSGVPFMIGGAYALGEYAGIVRDTKDLDVFCRARDYQSLLQILGEAGYETEITDANWLAKARLAHSDCFVDLIFNSGNGLCPVDDSWLEHATSSQFLGFDVKLVPAEEEIWQKLYVQDRHRFDGADIYHILRKRGREICWKRLLMRMEPHWEVLLAHLINYRFIYPSERDVVPRWVMDELGTRLSQQLELPEPQDRICRGHFFSKAEYQVDLDEWGYRQR